MTLIAHISDPHICARGELLTGTFDTAPYLAAAVDHINTQRERPDAVIVTGDLTNDGRADQYEHLLEHLDRLQVPAWCLLGNHDHAEVAAEHLGEYLPTGGPRPGSGVIEIGDVTVAAATSARTGRHGGELDADDIAHVAATLRDAPGDTLVALHHPPHPVGLAVMDTICLDADSVARLGHVLTVARPAAVLCGHLHRTTVTAWAGTTVVTAGSVAHSIAFDLRADAPLAVSLEPPSVLVHRITDGYLTTHVAAIGEYPTKVVPTPTA